MTTLSTTLAKRLEDPRLFRQYAYVNGKWTCKSKKWCY